MMDNSVTRGTDQLQSSGGSQVEREKHLSGNQLWNSFAQRFKKQFAPLLKFEMQ